MGHHLELSLVTEYNDGRVWAEAMLTRQGANEVRIDRGGQMGGGIRALVQSSHCSKKRPIKTGPEELIRWRRCLPYIQTFLVLIFLTTPPPQQLLGLMETIY